MRRWIIGSGTGVMAIIGIILGESWIIALVVFLGFFKGFLALTAISVVVSWLIVYLYGSAEKPNSFNQKIKKWLFQKEERLSPTGKKLAKTSKGLGLIVSSITAGPFLTTIFIKTLGYSQKQGYFLSFLSSVFFSFTWAAIYSGAIMGFKEIIGRIL
ncbi:MAG: hypothetical protein NT135_02620 [Candidatus Berkelbacteria bacterium]|nr:hypothetical protein [Candidatus Berkelbacteria bacterium]